LWHERDISHSSVERIMAPDACIALDFALMRMTSVIDKLLVYPDTMMDNLNKMGGLVFSQKTLLALTQAGIAREDAYRIVQRNAMKVWESRGTKTLLSLLLEDEDVTKKLDKQQLEAIFVYDDYIRHVDMIIDRTLA
jgi:adenylosuccinate lyase